MGKNLTRSIAQNLDLARQIMATMRQQTRRNFAIVAQTRAMLRGAPDATDPPNGADGALGPKES